MNQFLRICSLVVIAGMTSSLGYAASIDCYKFFPGIEKSLNCEELPGVPHPDGTNKLRIFRFVDEWHDDLQHRNLIEDIQDALRKAPPIFMKYGPLPSIHVVITNDFVENGVEYGAVAKIYEQPLQTQPCLVQIFQDFLTPGFTREQSRQVIAHEVFHCFQFKNRFLAGVYSSDLSNKWWGEGSSEFFSNLVYPSANEEFRHIRLYDSPISLNYQPNTYTTAVFFQAISNLGSGPSTVMSLLRQMPNPSTHELVVQSLSSFPQMDFLFHRFGQSFYDDKIYDTGGGKVPLPPQPGKELIRVEAKTRNYEFDIVPFALDAKTLKFLPGGKDGPTGTLQATVGVPLRRLPKLIKDLEHLCPKGKLGVEKLNTYLTKAGSSSLLDWEICRMLQHRMNPDRIEELKEELIGVVALVSSYIYGAKIATVFLKDRLPLVAKTDLGTILGLVKKEFSADFLKQLIEQTYYETNIASYGDMFTNYQHLYRGVLTARRDVWLAGAISGRDTLQERYSPKMEIPSVDQVIVPLESIGALGDKMDSVNGKPAPIFEIRCLGSFDHRADWMKKAREVFQYVQGLNTPLPKEVKDGLVPK